MSGGSAARLFWRMHTAQSKGVYSLSKMAAIAHLPSCLLQKVVNVLVKLASESGGLLDSLRDLERDVHANVLSSSHRRLK